MIISSESFFQGNIIESTMASIWELNEILASCVEWGKNKETPRLASGSLETARDRSVLNANATHVDCARSIYMKISPVIPMSMEDDDLHRDTRKHPRMRR